MQTSYRGIEIALLQHAAVRLRAKDACVCIDPFQLGESFQADVLCITHEHYDHLSPPDIGKVATDKTTVFAAESACQKIQRPCTPLRPGQAGEAGGVKVKAVEAYNTDKPYHPRGLGVGFVVELEGVRVYHAGDTDFVPEMEALAGKVDVALLPVSGTYVMDAAQAAQAARAIQPKLAIPMHYGAIVGSRQDAKAFAEAYPGKTEILL